MKKFNEFLKEIHSFAWKFNGKCCIIEPVSGERMMRIEASFFKAGFFKRKKIRKYFKGVRQFVDEGGLGEDFRVSGFVFKCGELVGVVRTFEVILSLGFRGIFPELIFKEGELIEETKRIYPIDLLLLN